jgi:Xaa-Pro aminopeptidase
MDVRAHVAVDEFRARTADVARRMRARGLDAVLAWSRGGGTVDRAAEVLWLTNYVNPWPGVPDSPRWSGQSYAAALVTADGECALVTNVPPAEWEEARIVCDRFTDDPFIHRGAATVVREHGLARARIGLAGRDALSVALAHLLQGELPEVDFVPADDLLAEARLVKSPAEQELIRLAGRAADATMTAMLAAAVPGATEVDAALASYAALAAHGGTPYAFALSSGPNAGCYAPNALPGWSDRTLEPGDLWHVDLVGSVGGYIFDFARTTIVGGDPTAQQDELVESAIAAVEAVIGLIEPGRPVGDAVAHGRRTLRERNTRAAAPTKHDYPHLGHTIGLGFEHVWLYENEQRPFEAGWYVAVEAVATDSDLGFAMFEQNMLVTGDGVELVTHCVPRPWLSAVGAPTEGRTK